MKKTFSILFILALILTSCDALPATDTSTPSDVPTDVPVSETATDVSVPETPTAVPLVEIPLPAGYGVKGSWFELYFTNPDNPFSSQETGGADGPLVKAIDDARLSVDVAIYSLSLNSVRDALLRAYERGVQVRMVMESDNLDRVDPQRLRDAGIPILGDRREGLMHDKFVVIDNSEVWMGSMNFTDSGAYADNNNLMRIHSVKMAENYAKEFEEMFTDDKFGADVVPETPNPRVTIDGTPIDVYFSPDDHVQDSFLDLVINAQESIYFMAFSFTSDPIGEAVRARAADGVTVAGIMETEQVKSNIGTEFDLFSQAGLDVYQDGNPGQMHHKVMIIDQSIVIFGSYNFTNSAETRNDENLLVVYNKEIAAKFIAEFQRVYARAR